MLKVQSDDQSLKISMESMKLKENQEEKYPRKNQYHSIRGQINQVMDHGTSVNKVGGVWHGLNLGGVNRLKQRKSKKLRDVKAR